MPASRNRSEDLGAAYQRLRHIVSEGQVQQAEAIALSIADMLEQLRGQDSEVRRSHGVLSARLVSGISSVIDGAHWEAIEMLEHVSSAPKGNTTLRWCAALWNCWTALEMGHVRRALAAAQDLIDLSDGWDARSQSLGLCAKAEVDAGRGEEAAALDQLRTACALFEDSNDRRGHAETLLTQGRILVGTGRDQDGLTAADQANALAPDWADPIIFRARLGLRDGDLLLTNQCLARIDALGPRPEEARRLAHLARMVGEKRAQQWVIAEYLRLREALPSNEIVEEIRALIVRSPGLYPLREELAWNLIRLGHLESARTVIEELRTEEQHLDPDTLASVRIAVANVARGPNHTVGDIALAAVPTVAPLGKPNPALYDPSLILEPEKQTEGWVERAVEAIRSMRRVFSGNLKTLGTSDLLEFLRNGRRSGILVLRSAGGTAAVYLRDGSILNASSPGCPNVGQLLVSRELITAAQWAEVSTIDDDDGTKAGKLCVEHQWIDAQALRDALTSHIVAAIRELFEWQDGRFALLTRQGASPQPSSLDVALDAQFILLEVARLVDESNNIECS